MLTNGFEQLAAILGDELGDLCCVELVRTKESITARDLLSGEDLEALCLSFENGLLTVRAVGEDDTVFVEVGYSEEFTLSSRRDLSEESLWNTIIGKRLWEVWALTNSRGYLDAIQFEFSKMGGIGRVRIQLEVVASAFRPFVVHSDD